MFCLKMPCDLDIQCHKGYFLAFMGKNTWRATVYCCYVMSLIFFCFKEALFIHLLCSLQGKQKTVRYLMFM